MSAEAVAQRQPDRQDTGVALRAWTRTEFQKAAELGWFDRKKVELRQGVVYRKPTGSPRLWTLAEYDQAAHLGWFHGERVELIRGEVYLKLPQNPPHATAIMKSQDTLKAAFGPDYCVRPQLPLQLPDATRPEPDLLVAMGSLEDYAAQHPTVADTALLVEIADTPLHYDLTDKGTLYAEAGIQDYWLVDLNARQILVCREPVSQANGYRYGKVTVFSATETVSPLARPEAVIRTAAMLPRKIEATATE